MFKLFETCIDLDDEIACSSMFGKHIFYFDFMIL